MVNKNGSMKINSATIDFDSETNKKFILKTHLVTPHNAKNIPKTKFR